LTINSTLFTLKAVNQASTGRFVMTFGQRLRELRKAKGLTQRDLADRVGLSFTYLSKIENGAMQPPRGKTITDLANALDADPDELFGLAKKVPSQFLEHINPEVIKLIRALRDGEEQPVSALMRLYQRVAELEVDLKHARSEQREKERMEFFHALIVNSQDAILVLNKEMELLYESPSAARMLGIEEGPLVGRDPLGIVHPDDVSRVANMLQQLAQSPGEIIRLIGRTLGKAGKGRVIEATAHSMVHIPEVNGIVVNLRDITEREQEMEKAFGSNRTAIKHKDYKLTASEGQVLIFMAEGLSNPKIAEKLVLSPATVRFHVSNILHKLGVATRTEAVALAMRQHLIEL
jgi:PAS domain S-box-containing protein